MFSKNNEWVEENRKEIEAVAYFRWEEAGKPDNQDKHFWEMAEDEIWNKQHPDEIIEITYPHKKPMRYNIIWDYENYDGGIIGGSY